MSKILYATLATLFIFATTASAGELQKSKYEVREVNGTNVVMISQALAENIYKITNNDSMSMGDKLNLVRSLVAVEGDLPEGQSDSFCQVSGETYKTLNIDAHAMAAQCSKRMKKGKDIVYELITDSTSIEDLRLNYSMTFMLMITY